MSLYGAATSTATPEILKQKLKTATNFKPFRKSINAWEQEVTQAANALRKVDPSLVDNHLLCEWLIDSVWNSKRNNASKCPTDFAETAGGQVAKTCHSARNML